MIRVSLSGSTRAWRDELYAVQATVGAGDSYIGAQGVADWYHRNLG